MNNQEDIAFKENIGNMDDWDDFIADSRQSTENESPYFWCIHTLTAWQFYTFADGDSNDAANLGSENLMTEISWGFTQMFPEPTANDIHNFNLVRGAHSTCLAKETFDDEPPPISFTQLTVHEVGHQFGLSHGDAWGNIIPEHPIMGIMCSGDNFINFTNNFIPRHLNLIRSRVLSPGQ